MPKIVDHDERREELLAAVWRILARDGIEGATLRAIAAETGWSSGVLQHYFRSKHDIIVSAHELAYARAGERIERRIASLRGIDALRAALHEALPLDEERLLEARIEVSAWNLAANDPDFAALRHAGVRRWWEQLRTLVADARQVPAESPEEDDFVAHELLMLVDALSVEAVLLPDLTTPERQKQLTERVLARIDG